MKGLNLDGAIIRLYPGDTMDVTLTFLFFFHRRFRIVVEKS